MGLTTRTALAIVAAVAVAACSAIVGSPPGELRCDPEAPNACPDPLFCNADGICAPSSCNRMANDVCNGNDDDCDDRIDEGSLTEPACAMGTCAGGTCRPECTNEVCNGEDDDCDDRVDEDVTQDADADAVPSCNFADPTQVDCDDNNGEVRPGAPERCNGFDDDCDTRTSEDAGCPEGQECVVADGATLPACYRRDDCRPRPTVCGSGTICDSTGTCITAPADCRPGTRCMAGDGYCDASFNCIALKDLGDVCADDVECASGLCYEESALGVAGGRRCGAPCCVDSDCGRFGAGMRCSAPGTGARSCLPESLIGNAIPQACTRPDHCGDACRVLDSDGGRVLACGTSGGGSSVSCDDDNDCESSYCGPDICGFPCGSNADCDSGVGIALGCTYFGIGGGHWATFCSLPDAGLFSSEIEAGGTCAGSRSCRDNLCFLGRCRAACCNDSTCGAGSRCAPIDNSGWEMRCLPVPDSLI